jgi:heat-inducible transcriptional repressor
VPVQIDERKKRILQAVIDDYIMTALPVGSRTISRKYEMGLSSATIRNEMSDLEELGYLEQPHISAGRVPNAKAYRLYVDQLLQTGIIPSKDTKSVHDYFTQRVRQIEDVVTSAAQAISEMTHYTSLVMMPRQLELRVSCLQLVPVSRATALLVIVTDSGIIRDTIVHVSDMLDADALYAISRMLTEQLAGRTLGEVQDMLREFSRNTSADARVLSGVAELISQMEKQSETDTVKVGGPQNILNYPEYSDVEKARNFLSLLETKDKLMQMLRNEGGMAFTVRIGFENGLPEMNDCSIVTANYTTGSGGKGVIGVIGPTRMPYRRVISTLDIVRQALNEMLLPYDKEEL